MRKIYLTSNNGFTLVELLIVVSLIALLAVAALVFFNPLKQIEKSYDGKRKNDLSTLKKVLEDWYNDKNCYPKPEEICFDAKVPVTNGYICHICGNKSSSPDFSAYLSQLPCDLQSPKQEYLYYINNDNCPSRYQIFTLLSNKDDPIIDELGCRFGCGISPNYFSYNYYISSGNTQVEVPTSLYRLETGGWCNICKSQATGNICDPNEVLYIDPGCTQPLFP